MGTVDRSQINELIRQSNQLEHGATQIALLEEAVRLADLLADVGLAFTARTRLITAANFGGSPEKAMVAFTWCLAQLDREPGRFDEFELLWQYKWVIGHLSSFPQITRAQIQGALADLARRVERTSWGMRPVYKLQYSVAGELGDLDEFHEAHERWVKSPRGALSDCPACDLNSEVQYLIDSDRLEEAIETGRPIFEGRSRCSVVPHSTLGKSLLPLVKLGRLEEAMANHRKGFRLVNGKRNFLSNVSQHIEFLALTANLAKGVKAFENHLTWVLETFDLFDRFRFMQASRFLFEQLQASGKKTIKLRLPSSFERFDASGKYSVAELESWVEADALGLGRRFDARNGNNQFARKIEAHRSLGSLVAPFPLRGRVEESGD